MKLCQIISPHKPHESDTGIARAQLAQRVSRVARAKPNLDICHRHTRMADQRTRMRKPPRHRRWLLGLQRIAGAHPPPDGIKPECLERPARDMDMPAMSRIKRASKKANTLTLNSERESLNHLKTLTFWIAG